MTTKEQAINDFNASKETDLREKITMYLCGLGGLAREVMMETNATDFSTNTTLVPKDGGMIVDVKVTVKKSKRKS